MSIASSWLNIDGTKKAVILHQVGHFYFGGVGQYYVGANTQLLPHRQERSFVVNVRIGRSVDAAQIYEEERR